MHYPVETFTPLEVERLRPHVTNLDLPVFCLTNLPETVKGALFARYSRYQGSLRRLFLDEFAPSLPELVADVDSDEGERAAKLYESVFVGYGDDSVAQLGGVHVAAEWCSNILTKIIQRGRIASYLEQSTRYIPFDEPINTEGDYRYYRDSELGPSYRHALDELFAIYSALIPRLQAWAVQTFPRGDGEPEAAWRRAIRAKALDAVRGLLPAASLSHVGIYASGQAYESLVMHLLAHPLPEANRYGRMMLGELKKVIPSFMSRIERPDRGGRWIQFLSERLARAEQVNERLGLRYRADDDRGPQVRLLAHEGTETDLLAAMLFEQSTLSEQEIRGVVGGLDAQKRARLIAELVGERPNRRHKPNRGFERLRYRFEIVSDYGAFRDLQRHRLLTCQWQTPTPYLGAEIPPEVEQAGCGDEFRRALEISRAEYERLVDTGRADAAPYALCLAYRIRYVLDLNAREAMHLCELRSGHQGHPSYRAVAIAMAEEIAKTHPSVAAAFTHLDRSADQRLERIQAEIRNERTRR
jgi:thymidylate synthase ThyX